MSPSQGTHSVNGFQGSADGACWSTHACRFAPGTEHRLRSMPSFSNSYLKQLACTTDCNGVYSTTEYKKAKQVSQIRMSRQLARGYFQVSSSLVPRGGGISTSPRAANPPTALSCRANPVTTGTSFQLLGPTSCHVPIQAVFKQFTLCLHGLVELSHSAVRAAAAGLLSGKDEDPKLKCKMSLLL